MYEIPYRRIAQRGAVVAAITSVVVHIPYFLMWQVVDGKLIPSSFGLSRWNLYYTTGLMIATRALPILILFTSNIMLLKDVNDAVKRRLALAYQPNIQVCK